MSGSVSKLIRRAARALAVEEVRQKQGESQAFNARCRGTEATRIVLDIAEQNAAEMQKTYDKGNKAERQTLLQLWERLDSEAKTRTGSHGSQNTHRP